MLPKDKTWLIDFNLQDVAVTSGLPVPDEASAAILDVSVEDLRAYVAAAKGEVANAADELRTANPVVGQLIEKLRGVRRVLAIGDSITTYRYSYARMLAHLMSGAECMNRGYSGYTSTHGLELTYTQFLALEPDLVFIMYGVNDCKIFGEPGKKSRKTLVSLEEFRVNMAAIVEAFRRHTRARIVLMTPTPVVVTTTNRLREFSKIHLSWQNHDLKARAQLCREVSAQFQTDFVDLYKAFGDVPDASLYLLDGLHPNIDGQQQILLTIAWALT